MLMHEVIQYDMREIGAAIHATLKQVQSGRPMEAWQPANLATFFPMFYQYVLEQHNHKVLDVFPWMSTRVVLPRDLTADNDALMAALDQCMVLAKSMKASGSVEQDAIQLRSFMVAFQDMRALMLDQIAIEEEVGVPMLRKHFTRDEYKPIEKMLCSKMTRQKVARFLNPMTKEEKKEFLTNIVHIPGWAQNMFILPGCKTFSQQWLRLLAELKAGQRQQRDAASEPAPPAVKRRFSFFRSQTPCC